MFKFSKDKKTKKKEKKSKRNIILKKVSISLSIFIVMFILLFGNQILSYSQVKVDYNKFITQLNSGKIESVESILNNDKVIYKLKNDDTVYYTNNPHTDDFLENILKKSVDVKIKEKSWFLNIVGYLITPLFMVCILFMFTKSTYLMADFEVEPVSNIKTNFKDVAGYDEIKSELIEISKMMKDDNYAKSGARLPKGVLLEGPPGNGKTLLARAFAGETGVNFIAVNACDFGSQFVGIGSNKIKKLFKEARKNSPCVIFIDEIDAVGAKRTSRDDSASKEMNTMITSLLTEMDGFVATDKIIVLAATNRASDLDEALIRPGRFDKQFVIAHPDKNARIELFKLYTKNKKVNPKIDFSILASKVFGFSCSSIECVVNEAIIQSVKNNHTQIEPEDFENAIIQISIKGHVKEISDRTEYEKKIVSVHEAGHAIIAHKLCNQEVSSICIKPTTSGAGGFTMTSEKDDGIKSLEHYKNELVMLLGGRAAEYVTFNKDSTKISTGASQDIKQATQKAISLISMNACVDYSIFGESGSKKLMSEVELLMSQVWEIAVLEISSNKKLLDKLSAELNKNEIISKEEFLKIVS